MSGTCELTTVPPWPLAEYEEGTVIVKVVVVGVASTDQFVLKPYRPLPVAVPPVLLEVIAADSVVLYVKTVLLVTDVTL